MASCWVLVFATVCCIDVANAKTVSVRAYGAKGDGTTDDIEAFDLAVAALNGSGTVLLPAPGQYTVSRPVLLQGGLTLTYT